MAHGEWDRREVDAFTYNRDMFHMLCVHALGINVGIGFAHDATRSSSDILET